MPEYQFKAMDAGGKMVFGSSNAANAETLSEILRGQGLFLMESSEVVGSARSGGAEAVPEAKRSRWGRRKVKLEHVAFFTAQLTIMVRTGLPLLESLEILSTQTDSAALNAVLVEISKGVSQGQTLSATFARHPQVFDQVYVSLLAAGEASGQLDVMLDRLTSYLEFRMTLSQKITAALMYPLIVVLTAIAVVTFLVVFVLPTFIEVFNELHVYLPLPTQILIFISESVRHYWYLGLAAAAVGWGVFRAMRRSPVYARRLDLYALRVPIVGKLIRNIALARVLRTMASLLESGVAILKTLDLAKTVSGSTVFYDLLEKVANEVRDGKPLSSALAGSPHVPRVVVSMILTGEKTGALSTVITRVAKFYEAETDSSIKNLFSALEPLFILGLGIMVGSIAVSVLLPMFDLARGIQ